MPGGHRRRSRGTGRRSSCRRVLDRCGAGGAPARVAAPRSALVVRLAAATRHRQDQRSDHQRPPAAVRRAENTRHGFVRRNINHR